MCMLDFLRKYLFSHSLLLIKMNNANFVWENFELSGFSRDLYFCMDLKLLFFACSATKNGEEKIAY